MLTRKGLFLFASPDTRGDNTKVHDQLREMAAEVIKEGIGTSSEKVVYKIPMAGKARVIDVLFQKESDEELPSSDDCDDCSCDSTHRCSKGRKFMRATSMENLTCKGGICTLGPLKKDTTEVEEEVEGNVGEDDVEENVGEADRIDALCGGGEYAPGASTQLHNSVDHRRKYMNRIRLDHMRRLFRKRDKE